MNIFGSDDSDDEPETDEEQTPENVSETPDEDPREEEQESEDEEAVEEADDEEEEEEEPEMVTLVERGEASFEYTEHEAEVTYVDGSSEVYTFDVMNKNSKEIVLKDYSDELNISTAYGTITAEPAKTLAFLTIERDELRTFETTERRDSEKTEQVEQEYEVERPDAEDYAEDSDLYYIKEDEQDEDE